MYGNRLSRQQKKGLSIMRGNSLTGKPVGESNPVLDKLKNMSSSPKFKKWLDKQSEK